MIFVLFSAQRQYHKIHDAELMAKLSAHKVEFVDYPLNTELCIVDLFGSVEINSLEDLQSLHKEFDDPLIIDFSKQTIEIYNDHIE